MPNAEDAVEFGLGPAEMDEMFGQIDPRLAAHIAASNILDAQQLINAEWIARVRSAPRLGPEAARDARINASISTANRLRQRHDRDDAVAALTPQNAWPPPGPPASFPFNAPPPPSGTFSYGAPSVPAPSYRNPPARRQLEEGEINEDMDEEKGGKSKKRRRSHKKRV
jgi:hypothetical protein